MKDAISVMGQLALAVLAAASLAALLWTLLSLFAAASRNEFVRLLRPCFQAGLNLAVSGYVTFESLLSWLKDRMVSALEALDYRHTKAKLEPWAPHWRVAGPLVYLALLVVMISGALYVGSLRLAVLLGLDKGALDGLPVPADLALSLAWLLAGGLLGLVYLDVIGATQFRLPWENLDEGRKHAVRRLAGIGVVAALLGASLEYAWGDLYTSRFHGAPPPAGVDVLLPLWVWLTIAFTLTVAIALTSWALPTSMVPIFWMSPLAVGVALVWPVREGFRAVIWIMPKLYEVTWRGVTFVGGWGRKLWNWLARWPMGQWLRLEPMEFIEPDSLEVEPWPLEEVVTKRQRAVDVRVAGGRNGNRRNGAALRNTTQTQGSPRRRHGGAAN